MSIPVNATSCIDKCFEDVGINMDNLPFYDTEEELDELLELQKLTSSATTNPQEKTPCRTSLLSGKEWVKELLEGHPTRIYENLRMDKRTFLKLCQVLRERHYLEDNIERRVSIEEAVAIFLYTVGHNQRQRVSAERFQHSTETINRHVKEVMRALCKLAKELIVPRNLDEIPPEVLYNPKHYPYFKDCVGALDGTTVSAWARASKTTAFRSRKSVISQNILAVCNFNMLFTYVHAGWEGSVNDSRVIRDVITKPELGFPKPPQGKYYVVDSGYPNMPGFLAPYRGCRYHLTDFRGRRRGPRTRIELFNYRHSSLRNVIERCFGVLKARFAILKGKMPNYMMSRQGSIVIACCVLHNFIRMCASNDPWFDDWDRDNLVDLDAESTANENNSEFVHYMSQQQLQEMTLVREEIAQHLWTDIGRG